MRSEREQLVNFLDMQRRGVLKIVEGMPENALRSAAVPSGWTPLGMVQHLTLNERYWLRWGVGGQWPSGTSLVDGQCQVLLDDMQDADEWKVAPHLSAEAVLARYRDEVEEANRAMAAAGLDDAPGNADDWWAPAFGADVDVRWIVLHMIEETAQHAGHLDIVRELVEDRTVVPPG